MNRTLQKFIAIAITAGVAFSTIAYGGIAMYAERFGTLSYVNGLNRWASTAGMGLAKKLFITMLIVFLMLVSSL